MSFNLILQTVAAEIDKPKILEKNSDIFLSVRFNPTDNIIKKRNKSSAKKLPVGQVNVSDGLNIYDNLTKERQKCFAHLIRKIKNPPYPFRRDKEKKEYEIFGRRVLRLLRRSMKPKRRSAKLKQKYENELSIIKRKISQQFENDEHIESYCMQLTLYKTAKMNNWDYKEYLHDVVSQKLTERI
ncbi:MAG: hypothetical protein ACTSVB_02600 [Candidatus Heimdallarchaeaceae archaeon]